VKGAPVIEIVSKIGKGSHGVVWKGFIDSRPVALKQISLEVSAENPEKTYNTSLLIMGKK